MHPDKLYRHDDAEETLMDRLLEIAVALIVVIVVTYLV